MNDEKFTLGKNYLIQKAPLWVHNQEKLFEVNQVINEYIRPSEKIEVLMKQWKIQIDWNPETALAVGIRGGNYEKYRYPGHAVQSTLGEIISEIELFLEKYPISKIYPQTHDYRNFEGLQKRFGKKLVQKPFSMQKFKNRSEFLSQKSLDRPNHWDKVPELTFEDNSKYLVDIYLVSEARYLISPLSNGMAFAFAKNVRNLIDYKIMNLGVYERK
jgi:hypothetical protein